MTDDKKSNRYGDNEAQECFHKGAFAKPHVPQKAMRKGLPSQSKKPQAKAKRAP